MPTRYYTAGEDRMIGRWMHRGADWLSRLCGMLRRPAGSIKERVLVLKGRQQDAATDEEDDVTVDQRDGLTIAIYRVASNDKPRSTARIARIVRCTAEVAQAELEYLLAGKMIRRTKTDDGKDDPNGDWFARKGFMACQPTDPVGKVYEKMASRVRRRPSTIDARGTDYQYFNEAPCRTF